MVAKTEGDDSYTKLLLHMNGTDTSTTFTDSSSAPHTMTANGNAQIDTAQSKFGGASGLFDGTGDYLSTPDNADFAFGSGDWTIDLWARFNSVASTQVIWQDGYDLSTARSLVLYYQSSDTTFHIAQSTTGSDNFDVGKTWSPSINTWYHIAAVRTGSVIKLFVDGSQVGTDFTAYTLYDSSRTKLLAINDTSGGTPFNGWLDEFRVSKGVARWTANFTPFTSEYVGAGYKLLMESDGDLTFGIDDDGNSFPEDSATSTVATYDDNAWHHVTAVKNGTTNIKLYVDGEEVASDTSLSATGTLANTGPFYLGIDSEATSNPWAGQLDETFAYSRALSASEIAELYRSSKRYAIEQTDANTVRLYNYSGSAQNLRLDVITGGLGRNAGTVSLAPAAADTDAQDSVNSIWVNKTGAIGALLRLQQSGTNRFVVSNLGQCVAAGTRIRRKKRKKGRSLKGAPSGAGPDPKGLGRSDLDGDYEDVPIEEIEAGDEVLTLDEQTGEFVWSAVEKTQDKDFQTVYALVTETGKFIETTDEHPYLKKVKSQKSKVRG